MKAALPKKSEDSKPDIETAIHDVYKVYSVDIQNYYTPGHRDTLMALIDNPTKIGNG